MKPNERIHYTFFTLYRNLLIAIGHNYLQKGGFKLNLYKFFLFGFNTLGFTSCNLYIDMNRYFDGSEFNWLWSYQFSGIV